MKIKLKSKEKEIDKTYPEASEQNIYNQSDIAGALKELNNDKIEHNRMSGIDLRARLTPLEISKVLAVDSLIAMNFIPVKCGAVSHQKKRLSVSINGAGRSDIIRIVGGEREQEARRSGFSRFFGSGNGN